MEKKERNSSIELLRIICIILIIAHHYSIHGGYDLFSYTNMTFGTIFIQILSMFGKCSCSVFAIITGYYLINSNTKNQYKKIIPLIFELFFYSIVIFIVVSAFNLVPISKVDVIKSLFPIFWGNWYVVYYVIFFLFVPYINSWIKSLKQKDYKIMLIILFIIWSFIPTFTGYAWEFSNFDFFIVMYLVGAYIRLYIKKKYKYTFLINIISTVLLILSVVCFNFVGSAFKINLFVSKATYFSNYSSILSVIWAVSTFMNFINFKFKSKVINLIAPSVLGIYLIHDNFLLNNYIWENIFPNVNYLKMPYIHAPLKIMLVFIGCLLIDLIRRFTIGKVFNKFLDKNYDKIKGYLNKILIKIRVKNCKISD